MAERDPLTLLHEAIAGALRDGLGARWRIEPIPWPMTVDELQQLIKKAPVAAVAFTGFRPDGGGRVLSGEAQFAVLVIVTSTKLPERFLGSTAAPGLYRGVMAAAKAVHGLTVTGLGSLAAGEIRQSYSDGYGSLQLALGVVPVTTHVVVGDVLGWEGDLSEFDSLATTWPTAPGAPTDDITLPVGG
ncbi:hypothetical protein [Segnochrobactrum spirostomi]|uniref:DUF1834 family protein n=1 Tax=Segnochrobactrum spirostomi TaxID=2608987 RepID=A0A6A7Y5B8_9HYPH|nr:hypothetical protein [Segnochrobactrum spirostomi]MQT14390.1 hypothetical protein [Segnochrobactrum spirostomi]